MKKKTNDNPFVSRNRRRTAYLSLVVCLAILVTAGVAGAFHLTGIAKTYHAVLTCTAEPKHGPGYADFFVHTHNEDCYDENGNLWCTLPEIEAHEHDASCYTTTLELICTTPESEGHHHTADCHTRVRGDLTCELSTEPVYDEDGNLVAEGHVHTDACYTWSEELTCGKTEGEGAHHHDDACYQSVTKLTCKKPVVVLHTHDEDCYTEDEDGNLHLTCGMLEVTEHVHGEECFTVYEQDDDEPEETGNEVPADGATTDETPEEGEDGFVFLFPEEEENENETGDDIVTDEATTDEVTTDEVTTDEATTDEVTTDEVTTDDVTTDEVTTDEVTTDEVTTDDVTTDKVTTDTTEEKQEEKKEETPEEPTPEPETPPQIRSLGGERRGATVLAEIPDGVLNEYAKLELADYDANLAKATILQKVNENAAEGEARDISAIYVIDIGFTAGGEAAFPNGEAPISITLRANEIRSMTAPKLYHLYSGTAEQVEDAAFDTAAGTVTFTSYGFSPFAVVELTGEDPAGIDMPAQNFHEWTDEVDVYVEADEGAFPAGTTMRVTAVPQEEVIDALNEAAPNAMVRNVQAVDITFYDAEGNEIEPATAIRVKMSKKTETPAPAAPAESTESVVMHVDNAGSAQIVENATVDNSTAEFESDSFSKYIFADLITEEVLDSLGNTYTISVTYGPEAKIPENSGLEVSEILETSEEYREYVARTESALGMGEGTAGYIRLFDIKIEKDGEKIQPADGTTVDVKIELKDAQADSLSVVHFADESDTGSVVQSTETEGQTVSFAADGFSVYAVVDPEADAHKARVKYVFQNTDGTPFLFRNAAGQTEDNQIIKDGESLENVGMPSVDVDGKTFNGWFVYDTTVGQFTGDQILFDRAISVSTGADATSITSTSVAISDADNAAMTDETIPDYTVYVRPYFGDVCYITFWNEVDGKVIYTKIQLPKGASYNIASQKAVPPDAIVEIDPITGEEVVTYVSYAFEGWATEAGTLEKTGQPDTRTAVTNTVITVDEDCEFYPIFRLAHWISFHTAPTGSGATYYAPVYVQSGQNALSARPASDPVWAGHTFVGWFETEDDDYLSVGETAEGAFNFNQTIDEDKTLYAHWNAGTANVTVIRWLQLASDDKNYTDAQKNYEYGGQENIVRDVNSVVYSTAFNDLTGYSINSARSDRSVIVKEDGTAVLNVYYDRKTIQMVFSGLGDQPGTYYTETTSQNGTQYGLVDGSYVQLTKGTIPVTNWSYRAFTTNTNSTNNVYGLVNGEYVPIKRNGTMYSADGQTEYTGTRYSRTSLGWGRYEYHEDPNGQYYLETYTNWWGETSTRYTELSRIYRWEVTSDGTPYSGTRYVQANNNTSYDSNRYIRSGDNYTNYTYTRTDSTSGTQYGVDSRGGHVQLTPSTTNQTVWYYTDMNGEIHVYEDTRYTKTTVNNTTVYTGLYGQTLEQNGYTWPTAPSGAWTDGNTYMSYLGQFILPDPDQTTIIFSANGSGRKYLYYYLQNVDGTYPNSATDTGYGPSSTVTFNFTEKYDGFTFDSYQRGNDGNSSGGTWTPGSAGGSVSIQNYNSIGIKYRRLQYNVKYLDSRNGTELSDVTAKDVVFGASLSTADPEVTNLTPPTSQYVWDGHWYTDQECTEIALFHDDLSRDGELGNYTSIDTTLRMVTYGTGDNAKTYRYQVLGTMPNHDISVYAGWNEIWYWVKIDPDGGVLTSTESTWFWETLGDPIEEYHDVVRQYVEDPDGEWYYHYDEFDTETETNQYGTNVRKAYYFKADGTGLPEGVSLPEGGAAAWSYDGKKYSPDNKAYSLVGWYEVDQQTGQLKGLYNFNGGISGNTIIRAVWRTVGEYTVKYSAEAVDYEGNQELDLENNQVILQDGAVPIDSSKYADKSNSSVGAAPTIVPEGYIFVGWYYDGAIYNPGDAFMIKAELADADKQVWLYPVVVRYEQLPVHTTHIHWYANYQDKQGNQISEQTESNQPSDTTSYDPVQINASADILDIDTLLNGCTAYAGYTFLGWAKSQNATEPWLKLESDGTYSMKDGSESVTGITKIAADENLPYDDLYAVWERKNYTVTVQKVVNSNLVTDQSYLFVFEPYFSASGLPTDYQMNFSLVGEKTTVTPENGEPITYYSQKVFENIPYGTTFSFTEGDYDSFELTNVKYTVTGADDTSKNVTDQESSNGATITVDGNTTVTFTNAPKPKKVQIQKIGSDAASGLSGATFSLTAASGVDFAQLTGLVSGDGSDGKPGLGFLPNEAGGSNPVFTLPVGSYTLTETGTPEGYIKSDNITITVGSDGVSYKVGENGETVAATLNNDIYTIQVVNIKQIGITLLKQWYAVPNTAPVQVELYSTYDGQNGPTLYGTYTLTATDEWKKELNNLPAHVMVDGQLKVLKYYIVETGIVNGEEVVPVSNYSLESRYKAVPAGETLPDGSANGFNSMNPNTNVETLSQNGTLVVGNRAKCDQFKVNKTWYQLNKGYGWDNITSQINDLFITGELHRIITYVVDNESQTEEQLVATVKYSNQGVVSCVSGTGESISGNAQSSWILVFAETGVGNDGHPQMPTEGLWTTVDGKIYPATYTYYFRETRLEERTGENTWMDVTDLWFRAFRDHDSHSETDLFNYRKSDLTIQKKWLGEAADDIKAVYFTVTGSDDTNIGQLAYGNPAVYDLTDKVATITLGNSEYYAIKIASGDNGWTGDESVVIRGLYTSRTFVENHGEISEDAWPEVTYTVTEVAYEDGQGVIHAIGDLTTPMYETQVRKYDSGNWQDKGTTPPTVQLGFNGDTKVRVTNSLTYDVNIFKTGADKTTPLSDAHFALYGSDYYDDNGTVNQNAQPLTGKSDLTSGSDGKIALGSLTAGTYYLLETQAPAGYNQLTKPVTIIIDPAHQQTKTIGGVTYPLYVTYKLYLEGGSEASISSSNEGVSVSTIQNSDGKTTYSYTLTVPNNPGVELPSTGGMGTGLFTAIGAILSGTAGAILTLRKRKA